MKILKCNFQIWITKPIADVVVNTTPCLQIFKIIIPLFPGINQKAVFNFFFLESFGYL